MAQKTQFTTTAPNPALYASCPASALTNRTAGAYHPGVTFTTLESWPTSVCANPTGRMWHLSSLHWLTHSISFTRRRERYHGLQTAPINSQIPSNSPRIPFVNGVATVFRRLSDCTPLLFSPC